MNGGLPIRLIRKTWLRNSQNLDFRLRPDLRFPRARLPVSLAVVSTRDRLGFREVFAQFMQTPNYSFLQRKKATRWDHNWSPKFLLVQLGLARLGSGSASESPVFGQFLKNVSKTFFCVSEKRCLDVFCFGDVSGKLGKTFRTRFQNYDFSMCFNIPQVERFGSREYATGA